MHGWMVMSHQKQVSAYLGCKRAAEQGLGQPAAAGYAGHSVCGSELLLSRLGEGGAS